MVTVEQLYKDYGVLADAGEKAGEVRTWLLVAFFAEKSEAF